MAMVGNRYHRKTRYIQSKDVSRLFLIYLLCVILCRVNTHNINTTYIRPKTDKANLIIIRKL